LQDLLEKKTMQNDNIGSVICLFDVDGTLTYPRQVQHHFAKILT
jgi:hypothetical protein